MKTSTFLAFHMTTGVSALVAAAAVSLATFIGNPPEYTDEDIAAMTAYIPDRKDFRDQGAVGVWIQLGSQTNKPELRQWRNDVVAAGGLGNAVKNTFAPRMAEAGELDYVLYHLPYGTHPSSIYPFWGRRDAISEGLGSYVSPEQIRMVADATRSLPGRPEPLFYIGSLVNNADGKELVQSTKPWDIHAASALYSTEFGPALENHIQIVIDDTNDAKGGSIEGTVLATLTKMGLLHAVEPVPRTREADPERWSYEWAEAGICGRAKFTWFINDEGEKVWRALDLFRWTGDYSDTRDAEHPESYPFHWMVLATDWPERPPRERENGWHVPMPVLQDMYRKGYHVFREWDDLEPGDADAIRGGE